MPLDARVGGLISRVGEARGARKQVGNTHGHVGGTVGRVSGCRGQPVARIDRSGDTAGLSGEGAGPMGGMESLLGDADGDLSGRHSLSGGCVGLSSGTGDRLGDANKRKGGEGWTALFAQIL